ncbi:MAG: hypothetical protein CMP50_04865 [Flavobacteriales bacterium]|nr:hypothetical protein [Flavobacteriales bacterium]
MKQIFFCTLLVIIFSCKKDNIVLLEGDFLSFSTDTLLFDTVFTTVGSATRYLKIYNNYDTDIRINSIGLGKQSTSSFQLNIDGEADYVIENTLLRSNDSLYIFAEVTIDPNNLNSALIETDSIIFTYQNQTQYVNLTAWGRDAYFHSGIPDYQQYSPQSENLASMEYCDFFNLQLSDCPEEYVGESFNYYSVNEHTTWTNDKPHVIYGDVIVENAAVLTIQPGSEIYLHNNSWLVVNNASSIHAIGTLNNEITFQSDRSDSHSLTDYAYTPGQWGKIWILPGSVDNQFDYTMMKNGQIGIQVDGVNDISTLPNEPMLTIKNSRIHNMSSIGILAQGSKVYGENLLIANCGQHLLGLNIGGDYNFKHCTFINSYPFARQSPSIFLNNYYEDIEGNPQYRDLIQASFGNCIIDGNMETEIVFDKDEQATFNYKLDHCVLKASEDYWGEEANSESQEVILLNNDENCGIVNFNQDDLTTIKSDFFLGEESIAIDAGSVEIANDVPYDIESNPRTTNPDIGWSEY